jgi:hypothetical protein
MRLVGIIGVGLILVLVLLFVVLGVDRSTAPLDNAGSSLVMPPMDAEVWYQGQGLPVRRSLLEEGLVTTSTGRIRILPHVLSSLPYKNNEENEAWVEHVNREYRPDPPWRFRSERRLGHYKCMSLSASTVRDWLRLREGVDLGSYTSMLNGSEERGLNPKILDSLYYLMAESDPELFPLTDENHYDPVAGIPVPYGMRGFVRLLTDPPDGLVARDSNLPGVTYSWSRDDLLPGYRVVEVFRNIVFDSPFHDVTREMSERVRDAVERHGILYAGIRTRFSASGGVFNESRVGDIPLPFLTGHAVAIVGWIEQGDDLYFIYRETFGEHDDTSIHGGPAYRVYPVFGFSEVYAFQPS